MTKLCPRGKAAAKRKFKVYPSAYANAYASKICAGKIKDPSGTKRKDWGPKKAKKGALMIIIGVGKKKKVDKKMGGGMTAGSMSGMGRLQKARMMKTGGGFDAGTPGKLRDIGTRYESDGIRFKPGKGPKMTPDRKRRLQNLIHQRNKKEKIKSAVKKAVSVASPVTRAISGAYKLAKLKGDVKGSIAPYITKKTGTSGSKNRPIVKDHSSRNPNPKTPKMMSGGFGIFSKKKKDKAEKKESNESKKKKRLEELRKEISTMNKGGMADYYKDLM